MKIKTTKGTINNNTTKHKITRDTATIFNFNIDNVTLASNTLTVTCTTITDETITYTLNLASGEKELPTALENLNVAGDINLFLAIAYKLYETGLEPQPPEPQPGQDPNIIVLDSIDCEELSYDSFLGGYDNGKIGFGGLDITLGAQYPQNTNAYKAYVNGLIEVESCTIGETEITCSQSVVLVDIDTIALRLQPNTSTTIDYNDVPIPVVTVIKNKQNDTTYTVEDTIEVQGSNVIFTNGGGAVTNYFILDNNTYMITLQPNNNTYSHDGLDTIITNIQTQETTTINQLGFTERRGNALYLNPTTNQTIEWTMLINNTTPQGNVGYQDNTIMSSQTLQDNDKITITATIKDENQDPITSATIKATYHKTIT